MKKLLQQFQVFTSKLGLKAILLNNDYSIKAVMLNDPAIHSGPYDLSHLMWETSNGKRTPINEICDRHLHNIINRLRTDKTLKPRYNHLRTQDWIDIMMAELHSRELVRASGRDLKRRAEQTVKFADSHIDAMAGEIDNLLRRFEETLEQRNTIAAVADLPQRKSPLFFSDDDSNDDSEEEKSLSDLMDLLKRALG
jgi:hypothetical protein